MFEKAVIPRLGREDMKKRLQLLLNHEDLKNRKEQASLMSSRFFGAVGRQDRIASGSSMNSNSFEVFVVQLLAPS